MIDVTMRSIQKPQTCIFLLVCDLGKWLFMRDSSIFLICAEKWTSCFNKPRILCIGNGVLPPHLQMGVTIVGFAEVFHYSFPILKHLFTAPFLIFCVKTELYFHCCMTAVHHKHNGVLPHSKTSILKLELLWAK